FILDAHGVKMSKSLGNIVTPEEVIEKFGRDVLRLYFLSSAPWDDYYFNMDEVKELARKFNVIRNVFMFVDSYVDEVVESIAKDELLPEDRWLISKLNSLVKEYVQSFEKFHGHKGVQALINFLLEDFSRWYVKLVRDRVWPLYEGKDKKSAFYTLFRVTRDVLKLLSPVCPFVAEDFYQRIVRKRLPSSLESVHMHTLPEWNDEEIDEKLESMMEIAREITEACLAARQKAKVKLRWPVKRIIIESDDKDVVGAVKELEDVIKRATNAFEVIVGKGEETYQSEEFSRGRLYVSLEEDEQLYAERLFREITRYIQELRKKNGFNVREEINLTISSDEKTNAILRNLSERIKKSVNASKVVVGKLEGEFRGKLKFKEKIIEIAFSK
ncbi:MAG: class I tRNA ligase family protein, partial [Candidatus Aenigmarchaeota archaeon]|nr:class I tRNA ligase family protein [Candidatus Aenigmarchaeota archaeon]